MVKIAVIKIPKPNIVAPPNFNANIPPKGAKKYPYENELRMKPFSCELH